MNALQSTICDVKLYSRVVFEKYNVEMSLEGEGICIVYMKKM